MKGLLLSLIILVFPLIANTQIKIGFGMTFSNDFFQSVSNPESTSKERIRNLLISPSFGPKVYLGNSYLSFSVQANVGISPIAFDWNNYKGMGVVYAPLIAAINYGGLTGFTDEYSEWGFSLGYGYHSSLTDIYFRKTSFRDEQRELFFPPFIQISGGFGGKGAALYLYSRFGLDKSKGSLASFGLTLEINFIERRKWRN